VAGAAFGFLPWNWQPARIFLGDVGSVPLGYALGWLLLSLAAAGAWAAALILPLYYLADATLTLMRRLARGERVWQAHREHFYQRATQAGRSHAAVVSLVALADAVLIALALGSARWPWAMLAAAVAAVALLLAVLARRGPVPTS
jgi:UDP-N-acetylmuramyl pentapeptide phosphotransferase/UDP-N-acetylglucosamine-1-phosphate transferase